jgi:hypothetical protein
VRPCHHTIGGCAAVPRTWCLLGHKAVENEQGLALADALGRTFELKRLAYRRTELVRRTSGSHEHDRLPLISSSRRRSTKRRKRPKFS